MVFAGTLLERQRKTHSAGADVPEKDTESIHIHAVVVPSREKFGCHVDWSTNDGTGHHGFRFAEPQISNLATIPSIQLNIKTIAR